MFEQQPIRFDGESYDAERDGARMSAQLQKVKDAMSDHCWHSLSALLEVAGGTTASVSSRVRDLRKKKFGGYNIESRCIHKGMWMYRMAEPSQIENKI